MLISKLIKINNKINKRMIKIKKNNKIYKMKRIKNKNKKVIFFSGIVETIKKKF